MAVPRRVRRPFGAPPDGRHPEAHEDPDEMDIRVECRAGYRGEEEPHVLQLGARRIEVTDIVDRWFDPRHRYFKLRGDDGATYLVRHDEAAGAWELTWFDAGGAP